MTTERLKSVDLLLVPPSVKSFEERVKELRLSRRLEQKTIQANSIARGGGVVVPHLSEDDEKELSTEALLQRHRFTELIFQEPSFKQSAVSVIQNIYLFRDRKIFFGTGDDGGEQERQEAFLMLTDKTLRSVPLSRTFQHNIIARIWGRIVTTASSKLQESPEYGKMQEIVSNLNTLRNIYMVLTTKLVGKLSKNINDLYRQSVTWEDACQISSFGVAKAAYRYHHSSGYRFSTYASQWVRKEIQRQALDGRLIKLSAHFIERLSTSFRAGTEDEDGLLNVLNTATMDLQADPVEPGVAETAFSQDPLDMFEKQDIHRVLVKAVDKVLSDKAGDVIRRRYGLDPYEGQEQSVVEIAGQYGVTRSSIYQLEAAAVKKLSDHLQQQFG